MHETTRKRAKEKKKLAPLLLTQLHAQAQHHEVIGSPPEVSSGVDGGAAHTAASAIQAPAPSRGGRRNIHQENKSDSYLYGSQFFLPKQCLLLHACASTLREIIFSLRLYALLAYIVFYFKIFVLLIRPITRSRSPIALPQPGDHSTRKPQKKTHLAS